MIQKKIRTLPLVLSELLEIALDDLRKIEGNPRYRVDMSYWYVKHKPGGPCYVCLGGAVMANTLGVDDVLVGPDENGTTEAVPRDYDNLALKKQLYALDQIRTGNVLTALQYMDFARSGEKKQFEEILTDHPNARQFLGRSVGFPEYEKHREEWWEAMTRLQQELKEAGL